MRWTSERNAVQRRKSHVLESSFIGKWKQWYRVMRYRKAFGRLHSVWYGLWLARG
jgi:hypothetical protein